MGAMFAIFANTVIYIYIYICIYIYMYYFLFPVELQGKGRKVSAGCWFPKILVQPRFGYWLSGQVLAVKETTEVKLLDSERQVPTIVHVSCLAPPSFNTRCTS